MAAAPPAGKIVASFEAHTAHGADAYSFVEGHAGAGVTAATLVLSDGSQVQTTIQNGWLVAWWPGSASVTSAQVTTASGTTTQRFDTQRGGGLPAASGLREPRTKDVACGAPPQGSGARATGRRRGSISMMNTAGGGKPAGGRRAP